MSTAGTSTVFTVHQALGQQVDRGAPAAWRATSTVLVDGAPAETWRYDDARAEVIVTLRLREAEILARRYDNGFAEKAGGFGLGAPHFRPAPGLADGDPQAREQQHQQTEQITETANGGQMF